MDVVGFGESSIDHVHVVSELPRPGVSKVRIESHYSSCGGQVATTMAACAALGLKSSYLGPLGSDRNGERIKTELEDRGVDLSRLIVRDAATRHAVIFVERDTGERIVFWERDSGLDVAPDDLSRDLVAGARVLHVDATDESASISLARLGREIGAAVTCDIETATATTAALLQHVSHPILAEAVPRQLTGVTALETALRAMRQAHHKMLCVTLGDRGAAALYGDQYIEVPATPVKAVDTTGAGDVFRAGFVYAVLQQWPLDRTLRFANAAAAISCTKSGAIASVPSRETLRAFL